MLSWLLNSSNKFSSLLNKSRMLSISSWILVGCEEWEDDWEWEAGEGVRSFVSEWEAAELADVLFACEDETDFRVRKEVRG